MKFETLKKSIINNIELLSPAGNIEKAKIALTYGADAIFLGAKQYSLRARSSNFSMEQIKEIVDFSHKLKKKVYLVSNVICKNTMLVGLDEYLNFIDQIRPDALIVSDPSIIQLLKTKYKNLEIHISTQQSTTNSKAAMFWKRNNARRVVLSRELTLSELELLMKNINKQIEIEVFIHGAVCISYSGRCMMSNHYSLRDSNIGGCAQSCRWTYEVLNNVKNNKNKKYFTMSAKDMVQIENLPQLINMGIASLKIEGRMKSYHYIATVTNAYKNALLNPDSINLNKLKNELKNCANREFDTAFMNGTPDYKKMLYHDTHEELKQAYIFDLLEMDDNGWIKCIVRNNFNIKNNIEILTKDGIFENSIQEIKDYKTLENITICPTPMQEILIKLKTPINIDFISFARKK